MSEWKQLLDLLPVRSTVREGVDLDMGLTPMEATVIQQELRILTACFRESAGGDVWRGKRSRFKTDVTELSRIKARAVSKMECKMKRVFRIETRVGESISPAGVCAESQKMDGWQAGC